MALLSTHHHSNGVVPGHTGDDGLDVGGAEGGRRRLAVDPELLPVGAHGTERERDHLRQSGNTTLECNDAGHKPLRRGFHVESICGEPGPDPRPRLEPTGREPRSRLDLRVGPGAALASPLTLYSPEISSCVRGLTLPGAISLISTGPTLTLTRRRTG